jgi:hypothetical protein
LYSPTVLLRRQMPEALISGVGSRVHVVPEPLALQILLQILVNRILRRRLSSLPPLVVVLWLLWLWLLQLLLLLVLSSL